MFVRCQARDGVVGNSRWLIQREHWHGVPMQFYFCASRNLASVNACHRFETLKGRIGMAWCSVSRYVRGTLQIPADAGPWPSRHSVYLFDYASLADHQGYTLRAERLKTTLKTSLHPQPAHIINFKQQHLHLGGMLLPVATNQIYPSVLFQPDPCLFASCRGLDEFKVLAHSPASQFLTCSGPNCTSLYFERLKPFQILSS